MSRNEASVKNSWRETGNRPFMKLVEKSESNDLSEIINSSGNEKIWKKCLEPKEKKVLICADERVVSKENEFKIGSAGQLILASPEEQDRFLDNWQGKISVVRSHSNCGAAGIAYSIFTDEEKEELKKKAIDEGLNTDDEIFKKEKISDSDWLGIYHSYLLAKKLDAKYEHTNFPGMRGRKEYHDARAIFFCANPDFDPSILAEDFLPPHFLANSLALGVREDYCREELKTLTLIALGSHGFGELFTAKNPFYVISVGNDKNQVLDLNKLAKDVLENYQNRIRFLFYA